MKTEAIDRFLSAAVIAEVCAAARICAERGGKIRMIRLPAEDFSRIVESICKNAWAPFRLTLCGFPVDVGMQSVPEIVTVQDSVHQLTSHLTTGREVAV